MPTAMHPCNLQNFIESDQNDNFLVLFKINALIWVTKLCFQAEG